MSSRSCHVFVSPETGKDKTTTEITTCAELVESWSFSGRFSVATRRSRDLAHSGRHFPQSCTNNCPGVRSTKPHSIKAFTNALGSPVHLDECAIAKSLTSFNTP